MCYGTAKACAFRYERQNPLDGVKEAAIIRCWFLRVIIPSQIELEKRSQSSGLAQNMDPTGKLKVVLGSNSEIPSRSARARA